MSKRSFRTHDIYLDESQYDEDPDAYKHLAKHRHSGDSDERQERHGTRRRTSRNQRRRPDDAEHRS